MSSSKAVLYARLLHESRKLCASLTRVLLRVHIYDFYTTLSTTNTIGSSSFMYFAIKTGYAYLLIVVHWFTFGWNSQEVLEQVALCSLVSLFACYGIKCMTFDVTFKHCRRSCTLILPSYCSLGTFCFSLHNQQPGFTGIQLRGIARSHYKYIVK